MPRQSPARLTLAAALALAICAGCAVSEPIDHDDIVKQPGTGVAGSSAAGTSGAGAGTDLSGIAGSTGGSAITGTAGTFGSAGAAGSGKVSTSGQAGNGTSIVTGGTGGDNVSGQAGAGGNGGNTGIAGAWRRDRWPPATWRHDRFRRTRRHDRFRRTRRRPAVDGRQRSSTPARNPDGAAAPTFTEIYTTILVIYCAGSSCHNPGTQGGIGFASQSSAYSAVNPRVTPGNGAGSRFYKTVNSGSMPRGAAKLSATNLAKIKAWIDAGALKTSRAAGAVYDYCFFR